MARELPSIGPAVDLVETVDQVIIDLIAATITEGVAELVGSKIEAGVALGGSVSFVNSFQFIPIVTAVPEVL